MLKKGSAGDNVLNWNLTYFVFGGILFFSGLVWVVGFQDGAAKWEDFYVKEIARVVDSAGVAEEAYIDVTPAVAIALKRKVPINDIFKFDNERNIITVKLSPQSGTSFRYFNEIGVLNGGVELSSGSSNTNRLHIQFVEVKDE